jgi:hypothetical protein
MLFASRVNLKHRQEGTTLANTVFVGSFAFPTFVLQNFTKNVIKELFDF